MVQKIKLLTAFGGAAVSAFALNMVIYPFSGYDRLSGVQHIHQ